MSTAFSQDFVQADRLIRRRYVQIPGKQKDLLERPDAWSENLIQGPHGMINVPPEVLQDVKDFHARRRSGPSQQPSFAQPPSSAASSAPPKQSRPKEPLSSPKDGREQHPGDDRGTQLSWSPSPPRLPPGHRSVQPTEQPELVSPGSDQLPSQPTLLKRKSPHMSLVISSPRSTAQSDAVPYEPPSALGGDPPPPVNRGANRVAATQSALPAATPPSAQAEVGPNTLSNTDAADSVTARPFNKRRRVEEAALSDKGHGATGQRAPPPVFRSRQRLGGTHDDRNTSSASVSTPSFPSQAAVAQHQRGDALQTASAGDSNETSSSHYTPTYEGRPRDTPTQQKNVLRHTASESSMHPPPAQPSAEPTHSGLVKVHQAHTETTVLHRTPYEEFKTAYPDYEESTRAFIRACLAVQRLESKRALPEFLYDDYVRAYSTAYMDYLEEAQRRNYKEVLVAAEWYNQNVNDMVYSKKIIRRDNLPAILKAHSVAVRQVKESIRPNTEAPESTEEADSKQESDEDVVDDGDQDQEEDLGLEESESEDISESRLSPEFHVSSPGPAATTAPAVVGDYDSNETGRPAAIVPASSRKSQYTGTAEEAYLTGSPKDDVGEPEGPNGSRVFSTFNTQELESVQDGGAPLKQIVPETVRTPSMKSRDPSQKRRDAPADTALKSGSSQRKLLAPLRSSSPSSAIASVINRPPNDKIISPPTKRATKHSSPAFRSQAESSDDESDSFDPPVKKAAGPPSRPADSTGPAFLTQTAAVYEIPGTPERQSEEPMPPPPRQSVARSPMASQPRAMREQTASTATTATALNQDGVAQRQITERERIPSGTIIGSSIGARGSPASSNRSRARLDLFKPRVGETKEERSKRNTERFKKFLSRKTPGSTLGATK